MDKKALKDVIYGGLYEIIHNPKYFYNGYMDERYSSFSDEGKEVLAEFTKMAAAKMYQIERAELDSKVKELVINNLKGDNIKP